MIKIASIIVIFLLCTACNRGASDRWYTPEQVKSGEQIYQQNCQSCHGIKAVGDPHWKEKKAPPPLNGSAHSWHHSMAQLQQTIREGGLPVGGTMPAFKDKLSEDEQKLAIAYFQSLWDDRVYSTWANRVEK